MVNAKTKVVRSQCLIIKDTINYPHISRNDNLFSYFAVSMMIMLLLLMQSCTYLNRVRNSARIENPFSQRFLSTKLQESINSCKIPLGEYKWILALGREFLTLTYALIHVYIYVFKFCSTYADIVFNLRSVYSFTQVYSDLDFKSSH